jgi:hypothetical protein
MQPAVNDLPTGVTFDDGMSQIVSAMPYQQLITWIRNLGAFYESNRDGTDAFFISHPQVGLAVAQVILLMDIMNESALRPFLQTHLNFAGAVGQTEGAPVLPILSPQDLQSLAVMPDAQKETILRFTPEQAQALPPESAHKILTLQTYLRSAMR